MELCDKCDDKDVCTKLCKKAEVYVSQDYISQKELTIDYIDNFSEMIDYKLNKYTKKTIINLYKDGMDAEEIMYHVPFNKTYVYRIVKEYKESL